MGASSRGTQRSQQHRIGTVPGSPGSCRKVKSATRRALEMPSPPLSVMGHDARASRLVSKRECLECGQPRHEHEGMTQIVEIHPPCRRGNCRRRIRSVHQSDHRRDEIGERQDAIQENRQCRCEPPATLGTCRSPRDNQTRQRQQCERSRRDIGPESQSGIVTPRRFCVPMRT